MGRSRKRQAGGGPAPNKPPKTPWNDVGYYFSLLDDEEDALKDNDCSSLLSYYQKECFECMSSKAELLIRQLLMETDFDLSTPAGAEAGVSLLQSATLAPQLRYLVCLFKAHIGVLVPDLSFVGPVVTIPGAAELFEQLPKYAAPQGNWSHLLVPFKNWIRRCKCTAGACGFTEDAMLLIFVYTLAEFAGDASDGAGKTCGLDKIVESYQTKLKEAETAECSIKDSMLQTAQEQLHEDICERLLAIGEGKDLQSAYKRHLQQRWQAAKLTPCMDFGARTGSDNDSDAL